MKTKRIRVLIVDDSPVMRRFLGHLLSADSAIEVVGEAGDAFLARDLIASLKPDVMTLDLQMPKMDGAKFLQKIMRYHPLRTIIVSSLARSGSDLAMQLLDAGAIDVVEKPTIKDPESLKHAGVALCLSIRRAAIAKLVPRLETPPITLPIAAPAPANPFQDRAVAIVASTGGTEALKYLLAGLPKSFPPVCVVQHMPKQFTQAFAAMLQRFASMQVTEAVDGEVVTAGRVYIAPGDRHMEVVRVVPHCRIRLSDGPPVNEVRPSGDILLSSMAECFRDRSVGVILTGMGKDGVQGLAQMKSMGAETIAQDEATSVVYGMPKEAVARGVVDEILPIQNIASQLISSCLRKDSPSFPAHEIHRGNSDKISISQRGRKKAS